MEIRNCKICGREFVAKTHNRLCCSDECRKINRRKLRTEAHRRYREEKRLQRLAEIEIKPPSNLVTAVVDLERYNRINGTTYSYGQAVAKGII